MKTTHPTVCPAPCSAWRRLPALLALGVIATLTANAAARTDVTDQQDFNFALPAGGALTLENLNGSARFVASPPGDGVVHVHAVKHGATEADLKSTEIEIHSEPGKLQIQTHYNAKGHTGRSDASVEYTVSVPAGVRLENVILTNGDLNLEKLTVAAVHTSCTNGRLSAEGLSCSGPITLHDVNGNLAAALLSLPGENRVELTNVNGDIQLKLPEGAGVNVKASTINGDIRTNTGLRPADNSVTGQKLDGRLGAGTTPVRLTTTNGSIRFDCGVPR